jgi:tRNA1Val (adenine37-N6)-methyltransferase
MKVGTDGALLGAWADCSHTQSVLDIGTGSGLIALMLAQRCEANIDAIDIDSNACRQAEINFVNSPFADRMRVFNADFCNFESDKKYDLIVSNPPFFSGSLKSNNAGRCLARHDSALPPETLISESVKLMNPNSKLALVFPIDKDEKLIEIAKQNSLFLLRKTAVFSRKHHPPKRVLLEFANYSGFPEEDSLIIETASNVYSDKFIQLLKDFYLYL